MRLSALVAELFAGEVSEAGVVNLDALAVRVAKPASITRERLRPGGGGGVDVQTPATTKTEVSTLATLAPPSECDLVDAGGLVLAGDKLNLLDRLEADLVGVVPVELESAEFAGGLVRRVRYSHYVNLLLGCPRLRGAWTLPRGLLCEQLYCLTAGSYLQVSLEKFCF